MCRNIERSLVVWLTRHQSKSATVHRYRCTVAVDVVRDLRPAVVRMSGDSAYGDGDLNVVQRSCVACPGVPPCRTR